MPSGAVDRPKLKNRVVLAANSSFETEIERQFWNSLDAFFARRDWALVHCAARPVPSTRFMFRTPHRLSDAAWFFDHIELPEGLPEWLSPEEFALIFEWDRVRFPEIEDASAVEKGLRGFAWYVDQAFRLVEPAALLVSNKIDPAVRLYWLAAPHFGAERVFCERSPFDGFWIEGEGMFGESEIPAAFAARDRAKDAHFRARGTEAVRSLLQNPEGFRLQNRARDVTESALAEIRRPRVFLPFDNILWTGWAQERHPQLQADYFIRERSEVVLAAIAKAVADLGGELFVKRHPCCRSLDASRLEGVRFLDDGDLETCLRGCDIVIGFNTKVIFPALALKKACVVLSPNPVTASGVCFSGTALKEVPALLRSALKATWDDAKQEKFETFCGWLTEDFYYHVVATKGAHPRTQFDFAEQLLTRIGADGVRAKSAAALPGIELLGELNRKERRNIVEMTRQRVMLVVDISRLGNGRLWNSGISRCIRDLVPALVKNRPESVVLFCESAQNLNSGEDLSKEEIERRLGVSIFDSREEVRAELARRREADGVKGVYLSAFSSPAAKRMSEAFDARAVIVHDLFHFSEPEFYGGVFKESNVTKILGALDASRDFVITVSSFTRTELHRLVTFPYWRTTVIPNAADSLRVLADEVSERPAGGRYFLFFAQSDPRKNVDATLGAIAQALADVDAEDDVRCIVVASSVYHDETVKTLASFVADSRRFEVISGPEDRELARLFRHAEFLVFTPLMEGFGLPALEAISLGCPVVASFTSSLPEVCGNAAIYVDPLNAADIADKISLLLKSETARSELRNACAAQAAKFSWDRSAIGLVDWIENRVAMAANFAPTSELGQQSPLRQYFGNHGLEIVPDRRLDDATQLLSERIAASEKAAGKLPESALEYARVAELLADDLRKARREIQRLRGSAFSPAALGNRLRGFFKWFWSGVKYRSGQLLAPPPSK